MLSTWLAFAVSALLIYAAGTRLSKSAEKIAEVSGLGGFWVGLVILPLSTSLPELSATWRAVSLGAPDLAIGNFLGSNLFNLGIIALIDLVQGEGAVFKLISQRHKTTVLFIIFMTILIIIGMLLPWQIYSLSPVTPLLLISYIVIGRYFLNNKDEEVINPKSKNKKALLKPILTYLVSSAVIVFAAINLADAANEIAKNTGFGETFVGSFFLAVSTSLPEIVTTTTAARLGALDMAVGNILGANLMNLTLILPVDVFYQQGSILAAVSSLHFVTAIMGIILASLVYLGLTRPSPVLLGDIGLNSVFILATFIASVVILFLLGVQV